MDSPGCCRNGHGIPDARIPDSNWQSNPVRLSYIFGYREIIRAGHTPSIADSKRQVDHGAGKRFMPYSLFD